MLLGKIGDRVSGILNRGDDDQKRVKGSVVLMKKNVLEFNPLSASVNVDSSLLDRVGDFLGNGISIQLIVSFSEESSSADELFSGGKMIPSEIKKKIVSAPPPKQEIVDQISPPQVDRPLVQTPCVREENSKSSKKETNNEGEERQSSKSFWGFKRSSSCGSGYGRTLCPLPLLSRSNSTGSADESKPINIKRSPLIPKESSNSSKQNTQKSSNASNKVQSTGS
ncbi:hypothetical protein F8388_001237 [Cannabis sativa]|uniref:Uncharacterized protein n=1 Tax=Cannabis sativa TaxID=3483 RepID=A0A7J6GGW3_CANSA|nr:hypothetical protein F8388_001237 [Cannabis sativa]